MLNIAVLVSGGGTNLQALLDSEARGENPNGKIKLVVASKPGVYALERAAKAGVEGVVVRRKDYAAHNPDTFSRIRYGLFSMADGAAACAAGKKRSLNPDAPQTADLRLCPKDIRPVRCAHAARLPTESRGQG